MSNSHLLLSMAGSLALTLVIELCFGLLLRKGRDIPLMALANLMTNPPLVALSLTLRHYAPALYIPAVAALELAAVLLEGLAYQRRANAIARPYAFSLAANALSFGIGQAI